MPTLLAHALSERAGCRLDSDGPAILGMSGTPVAELTEIFDVVERDGKLAELLVFSVYAVCPQGVPAHRAAWRRGR